MLIRKVAIMVLLLAMAPGSYAEEFLLTGVHKEYYSDGTIKSKIQYKNGKQSGYVREYHPNGRLAFVQYVRDGKINGPVKAYYSSGRLKGEVIYVNNSEHGRMREYYESGTIKEEALYVRGKIIQSKLFDDKGRLVSTQEGNFPNGCVASDDQPEGF